jgi:hypothetical protein
MFKTSELTLSSNPAATLSPPGDSANSKGNKTSDKASEKLTLEKYRYRM